MPFSEKLKHEVKRKAAFRCCRCNEIGVDIHHILLQAENGSDEINNAAPLCQNCHDRYGANPDKRKEIRQMRDWWYEVVEEKYGSKEDKIMGSINELLLKIQDLPENNAKELVVLRSELISKIDLIHSELKETIHKGTASRIHQSVSKYISATRIANNVHTNFHCTKCNTSIGLLIGSSCPSCHQII